ncbi:Methyltransferase domain-containing protein [Catalinimonas alkaloidigena]|uniref:Methyltransferase domain-containing protein n=1 Tax=Catalinimonas alkaloidigena TaxID=1075417 RepID=A0A1G9S8A7_9BACT|nr:class I SAM-dependent methyltransferase [Catalinimonas alkaloidigena]SDM31662.1 Methyltransferase domain-containing protein [Catalinimonas alkaloidigena]
MSLEEAIRLLASATLPTDFPQQWADLGCGSGLFSQALASFLPSGSRIFCVDKERQTLRSSAEGEVTLEFLQRDFVRQPLLWTDLEGVLMANSLHYVHNQAAFLRRTQAHLTPQGHFLLVEYDTEHANRWVPYPLSFARLEKLADQLGFAQVNKLAEHPSIYGHSAMYACELIP